MVEVKGIDLKEVFITGFSVIGAIIIVFLLILFGWFLIWKMFLIRFSFIRELVYGSEEATSKKSQKISTATETPLRRSSRLRERQSKNQHGQL